MSNFIKEQIERECTNNEFYDVVIHTIDSYGPYVDVEISFKQKDGEQVYEFEEITWHGVSCATRIDWVY